MTNCPTKEKGFRRPGPDCATAGPDGGMCSYVDMVYYERETDLALIKCLYPKRRES